MSWQEKGRRAAMGQYVRAKAERMVLIRFDGEPKEVKGKNFNGQEVDELDFPVTFWDERSVALKYKEGEAAGMVRGTKGEVKIFPVSSPPLMRELLEEDEAEPIMGRTFIISHTGTARDTAYKFREVKVPKQKPLPVQEEEEETYSMEGDEEEPDERQAEEHAGPNPRKEPIQPPTKKGRKSNPAGKPLKPVFDADGKEVTDPEKLKEHEKFMKEVKKRAKKTKAQAEEVSESEEETEEQAEE